jgi:hypothetical protein
LRGREASASSETMAAEIEATEGNGRRIAGFGVDAGV